MPDLTIHVDIARPRNEVLAWWTGFPDEYSATDPREQPHRIKVLSRSPGRIELHTWWRAPLGRELVIPETFHLKDNGDFDVDVHLDTFGLLQVDRFQFAESGGRTHVRIDIDITAKSRRGKVLRPVYLVYARRQYPRNFRGSGKLCERDAPKLA